MVASNFQNDDLKSLPFFSLLKDQEKSQLLLSSEFLNINHGKIFSRGDECRSIYFVVAGSVKLFFSQTEEKQHISTILHKGQLFGECSLFGKNNHLFDVEPIEDKTKILVVSADCIKSLMKTNFDFNLKIMELIGQKIERNEERLFSFAMKDARQRILGFLKDNVESNGKQIGLEMLIKHGLTQQDIANFTGTSRQTVTTVLNDLKSRNKIHLRRKSILIRDIASLA
jgi:CRP/FNR family transcriptional regulator, cyclic AMP receptor protein